MNFVNLSLPGVLAGLAVLAGILFALQQLRARHTEVTVPTTLFWAAVVRQAPVRILRRRFRHWLAWLLILAIASLLWIGFAGPEVAEEGSGNAWVLYLDGSAHTSDPATFEAARAQLIEDAAALPAAAREVMFGGAYAVTLLRAGEDAAILEARLDGAAPEAAPSGLDDWLRRLASDSARPERVNVVIYGRAPVGEAALAALPEGFGVARAGAGEADGGGNRGIVALGVGEAASGRWDRVDVRLSVASSPDSPAAPGAPGTSAAQGAPGSPVALGAPGTSAAPGTSGAPGLSAAPAAPGSPPTVDDLRFRLGGEPADDLAIEAVASGFVIRDLPAAGATLEASLVGGDAVPLDDTAWVTLPARRVLRVAVGAGVPAAVRGVIQAHPGLEIVADGATDGAGGADVAVRASDRAAAGGAAAAQGAATGSGADAVAGAETVAADAETAVVAAAQGATAGAVIGAAADAPGVAADAESAVIGGAAGARGATAAAQSAAADAEGAAIRVAADAAPGGVPVLELVSMDAQDSAFEIGYTGDRDAQRVLEETLGGLGLDQIDATNLASAMDRAVGVAVYPAARRTVSVWSELLDARYNFVDSRAFPVFVSKTLCWLAAEPAWYAYIAAGRPVRDRSAESCLEGAPPPPALDALGADYVPGRARPPLAGATVAPAAVTFGAPAAATTADGGAGDAAAAARAEGGATVAATAAAAADGGAGDAAAMTDGSAPAAAASDDRTATAIADGGATAAADGAASADATASATATATAAADGGATAAADGAASADATASATATATAAADGGVAAAAANPATTASLGVSLLDEAVSTLAPGAGLTAAAAATGPGEASVSLVTWLILAVLLLLGLEWWLYQRNLIP